MSLYNNWDECFTGSTSGIGNIYLRRAAGEVVEMKYDPDGPEDSARMWLEFATQFIQENPEFSDSVVFAEKDEEGERDNYILGMTAATQELHDKLDSYIEQMIDCEGPFEEIGMVLSGDMAGIPDKYNTNLGFAFITLY